MYTELNFNIISKNYKIFFKDGLRSVVTPAQSVHAHSFAELHLVACESSVLNVNSRNITLKAGDMAVIPKGVYHRCVSNDDSSGHTAFQIDCDVHDTTIYNIGNETMESFFKEIRRLEITGDYTAFSAYVALFVSYFDKNITLNARPVTNRKFLIREFMFQRYSDDVHLSDLAEQLYVSERQAERLVIEHMGRPFREELARTRIIMAENLLQTTDMTLCEVGAYVGYKSYSGFWKALQKYRDR